MRRAVGGVMGWSSVGLNTVQWIDEAYIWAMSKSTVVAAADDARGTRQRAVADARRSLVLDAARGAFLELGLDGASMREIARRAGYTPGAIYSYYASKEEMYGALLGESLARLN